MGYRYTIPGTPITKKNSMRMVTNHKTGKLFPIPSKAYQAYMEQAYKFLQPIPLNPIDQPVRVTCTYYMPTKRPVDLVNLMEATHDILVKFGILKDDNSRIIVSVDGSRVLYDKEDPRAEIAIVEE